MTAARAVSWIFVPEDRPDRFDRAVADWLATGAAWMRVNAAGNPWHDDHVRALAAAPVRRAAR